MGICRVDVSFLFRSQGSRLTPLGSVAILHVSGVSSSPTILGARKPHTNSPAQLAIANPQAIRISKASIMAAMNKKVILVTGTPCVGKTTIAKQLGVKLDGLYINLTELAMKEKLTLRRDEERNTTIISEVKMRNKLREIIGKTEKTVIVVDGHYAAAVTPKEQVAHVFVLRRDPRELRGLMEKCGFSGPKLWENLAAEILDVCLAEALREQEKTKVCELDISHKTVEEGLIYILEVLDKRRKCQVGCVDWLGMLEKEDLLDEYLKT
jgi:adenylate kinase